MGREVSGPEPQPNPALNAAPGHLSFSSHTHVHTAGSHVTIKYYLRESTFMEREVYIFSAGVGNTSPFLAVNINFMSSVPEDHY